ncbi:MAG: hypothetical protein LBC80_03635 [Treponema sp.]|jgi:hypothetical protein|nr:hypothetical protein [Treponema sp.]
MNVLVFTNKDTLIKKIFPAKTQYFVLTKIRECLSKDADIFYIDIAGLSDAEIKKTLDIIKKGAIETPWGIIDSRGIIKDPAAIFFEGASDYIGSHFFKDPKKIVTKRFDNAIQWYKKLKATSILPDKIDKKTDNKSKSDILRTGIKFPAAKNFPGWKKMETGKTMPFFLLYCSMQGKDPLDSRVEEKALSQIYNRFVNLLNSKLKKWDGLNWIDTGNDCLFLLPPKQDCVEATIKDCLRMIICAPLISLETLMIKIPVNFVFALHYGTISYKPPGKTGTVVSDAVNAVYHLGAKKAQPGRLTISSEVPDGSVPKSLEDCFVDAGVYEGRKIWHSKKFSYEKPWV